MIPLKDWPEVWRFEQAPKGKAFSQSKSTRLKKIYTRPLRICLCLSHTHNFKIFFKVLNICVYIYLFNTLKEDLVSIWPLAHICRLFLKCADLNWGGVVSQDD